jgi:regulator of protease activity HflC (stomatin/prohibitin superfamily)
VRTIDGQEVLLDVTLIYRINPASVNTVHRNWQTNYESNLVIPVLRGFVRDVVSGYRAEAVYGESREAVQQAIEDAVSVRLSQEGLEVTDLIVRNVTFSSEEFAQSIERVQIAERQAEEAAFRVQQEEQEAARVRVRAEGSRDATIAEAEGEAESVRLLAQAQADALALVSEQLAANPLLIQYEYIRNLSDNVTLVTLPSNSPFLFDIDSLMQSAPQTVPPVTATPDGQ